MSIIAIRGGSIDILIDGDVIAATGSFEIPAGAETINATGLHVAPGLVDFGVFAIERAACAAGGITRVALMPDQSPPLDDPGLVQRAALAAKPHLWVHPVAAATRGLQGKDLAEYALMRKAGAKAVATGRHWIADSGVMHRVLAYAGSLGLTVITHAEDGGLTRHSVATQGETATRHGLPAAPAISEAIAIARDIMLAEDAGAAIHFRQVTTRAGFERIRRAKARRLRVTCGITPAHLLLSDIATSDFRTFARLSPPLRCEDDRQACLEALADGTIDLLCSGHDPRGPEAKRLPFVDAEPGMAGAETLLTLGLGLVRDGMISMDRLIDLTATNPAKILGIDAGTLRIGGPSDICLFDANKPWQIRGLAFASDAGNTPFDGLPAQGKVVRTIKGGRTIYPI
jgi:dihydroorotase